VFKVMIVQGRDALVSADLGSPAVDALGSGQAEDVANLPFQLAKVEGANGGI
jgi:hypothetical protein